MPIPGETVPIARPRSPVVDAAEGQDHGAEQARTTCCSLHFPKTDFSERRSASSAPERLIGGGPDRRHLQVSPRRWSKVRFAGINGWDGPVAGVLIAPCRGEQFAAMAGAGATLNGVSIPAAATPELSPAIVEVDCSLWRPNARRRWPLRGEKPPGCSSDPGLIVTAACSSCSADDQGRARRRSLGPSPAGGKRHVSGLTPSNRKEKPGSSVRPLCAHFGRPEVRASFSKADAIRRSITPNSAHYYDRKCSISHRHSAAQEIVVDISKPNAGPDYPTRVALKQG